MSFAALQLSIHPMALTPVKFLETYMPESKAIGIHSGPVRSDRRLSKTVGKTPPGPFQNVIDGLASCGAALFVCWDGTVQAELMDGTE